MTATNTSTVRLGLLDRRGLDNHFLSLAAEDRRLRFGASISDDSVRAYVARLDFERDGLFAVQDDQLRILAVVHVAGGDDHCEMGLSVLEGWRQQGLGNALFKRALTFLRTRGSRSVFVHCLSENASMMHLARKHGMRLTYSGSESDAHLELPPATVETYTSEWLEEQRGRAVQAMRQKLRFAKTLLFPFGARA